MIYDDRSLPCSRPLGRGLFGDAVLTKDPGSQQVYGTGALRSPTVQVLPAPHTDNDVLLVRARLLAKR